MRAAAAGALLVAACTVNERVAVPFMPGEPGTTEILAIDERVYAVELGSVFEPEEPLPSGGNVELLAFHYPRSLAALGLQPGRLSPNTTLGPLLGPYSAWTLTQVGPKMSEWTPARSTDPRLTAYRPRFALGALGNGSGEVHTCFLGTDRRLYCTGASAVVLEESQVRILGRLAGLRDDVRQPTALPGIDEVSLVTSGNHHTCYARQGSVYCFGSNEHGQLGREGSPSVEAIPVQISGVPAPSALVAFGSRTCALSRGRVYCWGTLYGGSEPGAPELLSFPSTVAIDRVAIGSYATCGLGAGHLYCQGRIGLLGLPSTCNAVTRTTSRPEPFPLPPALSALDGHIVQVGLGDGTGCILTDQHDVYCWGCNSRGQLGTGQSDGGNVPEERGLIETPILRRAVELRVGAHTACAIDQDRALWCWGWNSFGQVGLPASEIPRAPHRVDELGAIDKMEAYYHHTCAQSVSGEVWCFGRWDCGQLGDGANGQKCNDNTGSGGPVSVLF